MRGDMDKLFVHYLALNRSNLNKNLFNQKETGYSSHSIIQRMENFVDAVHEMDDTILVPSRLMDLKVENVATKCTGSGSGGGNNNNDCKSPSLVAILTNLPDLFTLYTMVRNLKNQLQWGTKDQHRGGGGGGGSCCVSSGSCDSLAIASADEDRASQNHLLQHGGGGNYLSAPLLSVKGHIRRPSTASVSSTNSSAGSVISEPDSEASMENDSGIDAELDACIKMSTLEILEQNFQRHLRGLGDTLNQLTEAARYVTRRYQKDVLGAE